MIVYGRVFKVPRDRFNAFLSPYDVDPLLGSRLGDFDEEEFATSLSSGQKYMPLLQ